MGKSFFIFGNNVKHGFNKKDPQACLEAYFEFKEIESELPRNSLAAFTDGSLKNSLAGAGTVVYAANQTIHKISTPLGNVSIDYAELFAVYSLLKWLQTQDTLQHNQPVHIFTDSMNIQRALCSTAIPERLFYLVEDTRNLAEILSPRFSFTIHWIPSHIESTAIGKRPIHGNVEADYLANEGQQRASQRDTLKNICFIRDKILNLSASLVSEIHTLLVPDSPPCDGPSSDDFSLSDAIRNSSRRVPWHTCVPNKQTTNILFSEAGKEKKERYDAFTSSVNKSICSSDDFLPQFDCNSSWKFFLNSVR